MSLTVLLVSYIYIFFLGGKKGVRINTSGKIPEGQVYVPRLEPTARIRLADGNPAHYPSRHCTILKKDGSMTEFNCTQSDHTGVIGRCLQVRLTHQICGVADVFPAPGGQRVKRLKHQIQGAKQEKLYLKEEGSQNTYE